MSLEVMNDLLALLAHEGAGNKKASKHDKAQMIIKWPSESPERVGKGNKAELKTLKDLDEILKQVELARTGEWCYCIDM